jgi:RNA polymerase sigma-B factor
VTATSIRHVGDGQHDRSADRAEARAIALVDALAGLQTGDPARRAARAAAIEAWQPLARRLALRYAQRGELLDDLTQVAYIGLIYAVDRFDPGRGTPFTAFAIPTITGEIKRHFRDRTWALRVPRRLQELSRDITIAKEVLSHRLGRSPTVADVAAHLGVTEENVLEGLEGARAYETTSLSTPVGDDGLVELGEAIGVAERGYGVSEWHLALRSAQSGLDDRDRRLIALRFYGDQTQSQIAAELGVSQMHISRLLARVLGRLRRVLTSDA